MKKEYIEVKIPVLDDVEEMEVVKTFNQQQLWYVCAIAKAYEKAEVQLKKQKEIIDKVNKYIRENSKKYCRDWEQDDCSTEIYLDEDEVFKLLEILEDKEV